MELLPGNCIRLYNEAGWHVASILRCFDGGYDYATPSGTVLYCGVCPDLVSIFLQNFGQGPI